MKAVILKRLLNALSVAISSERDFIDAHETSLKRNKAGLIIPCVPKEHRSVVSRSKRIIDGWKECRKYLIDKEGEKV